MLGLPMTGLHLNRGTWFLRIGPLWGQPIPVTWQGALLAVGCAGGFIILLNGAEHFSNTGNNFLAGVCALGCFPVVFGYMVVSYLKSER